MGGDLCPREARPECVLGVARAAAPPALSGGCSAQTPSASPADSRARARPPGGSQRFAWPSAPGPQLVPRESRENRKLEWGSRTGNAGTLATVRSRKGDSTRPRCPRGRERERAGESGWAVPCRGGVIGTSANHRRLHGAGQRRCLGDALPASVPGGLESWGHRLGSARFQDLSRLPVRPLRPPGLRRPGRGVAFGPLGVKGPLVA